MTAGGLSVIMASSTVAQLFAGWTAVLPMAALAIYGWYRGGFLAVIAGLQVVASFLTALALARPVSSFVESLGCPSSQSLAVAYVLLFLLVVTGIRLAVGASVPEGAVRLAPLIDQLAGVASGVTAGLVLGGAILVGWSMADLPAWMRLDNTHQPLDTGGRVLWMFARYIASGPVRWERLLDGDRPDAGNEGQNIVRASEPFADGNANGRWDAAPAAEPFLDVDRDGNFTRVLAWSDADGDDRRDMGLRDFYRLADWRRTRVMHAPRITSDSHAEVQEHTPVEQPVYRGQAGDVDGDTVTFSVETITPGKASDDGEENAGPGVVIDAATGVVTLVEEADFERAKSLEFTVVATDATGLTDRKAVRIRVRDVVLEPASSR